jgi:hypothetical protein
VPQPRAGTALLGWHCRSCGWPLPSCGLLPSFFATDSTS